MKSYHLLCASGQASWIVLIRIHLQHHSWCRGQIFFFITAFLSLGKKNTLSCHESSPVQVQGISRHVQQKAKPAKSPQRTLKSCYFTDSREQRAREQSHHKVIGISSHISTAVGDNLSTHSTACTV